MTTTLRAFCSAALLVWLSACGGGASTEVDAASTADASAEVDAASDESDAASDESDAASEEVDAATEEVDAASEELDAATTCTSLPLPGNPACNACVAESCCESIEACLASVDCVELTTCFEACAEGDSSCIGSCVDATAGGLEGFDPINLCASTECSGACG